MAEAKDYLDFKSKRAAQVEQWAKKEGKVGPISDPSSWVYFSQGKIQDWVSLENIMKTIDLAKKYNIDPALLAGVFMNESAIGTRDTPMFRNPGHVNTTVHGKRVKSLKERAELDKKSPLADYAAKFLSEKLEKRSGDTEQALRDYVGRGKTISYAHESPQWYGIPSALLSKADIGGKYVNKVENLYNELLSMPELSGLLYNTERPIEPTIWDKIGLTKILPFISDLLK